MKKAVFLVTALALAIASNVQGQTSKVAAGGDKAVLFDFSGFNTNMYMGGIGGKYFVSDGLAIRGILMFGVDDKTLKTPVEQTDNSLLFGIGAGLEYHLPLSSSVSPFVGGGLSY